MTVVRFSLAMTLVRFSLAMTGMRCAQTDVLVYQDVSEAGQGGQQNPALCGLDHCQLLAASCKLIKKRHPLR
jgi:hypothetical protein